MRHSNYFQYVTQDDIKAFYEKAKELALEGDRCTLKYMLAPTMTPPKKAPIDYGIPEFSNVREALFSLECATNALFRGDISADDLTPIKEAVDTYCRVKETAEYEDIVLKMHKETIR